MGDAFGRQQARQFGACSAALSIAVPSILRPSSGACIECRGKRSPDPNATGHDGYRLNRLHFGFRRACIQRRFRFE